MFLLKQTAFVAKKVPRLLCVQAYKAINTKCARFVSAQPLHFFQFALFCGKYREEILRMLFTFEDRTVLVHRIEYEIKNVVNVQ